MAYQVFISYKHTSIDGSGITRDYDLAKDLHETLLQEGIAAFFSDTQPEKAREPISVSLSAPGAAFRDVQPSKAETPIFSRDLPDTTFCRPAHPLKACGSNSTS